MALESDCVACLSYKRLISFKNLEISDMSLNLITESNRRKQLFLLRPWLAFSSRVFTAAF